MSFCSASAAARVSGRRQPAAILAGRLLVLLAIVCAGPVVAAAQPAASRPDAPYELIVPGEFHYRAAPDFRPVEVRVESYVEGIRQAIARRRADGRTDEADALSARLEPLLAMRQGDFSQVEPSDEVELHVVGRRPGEFGAAGRSVEVTWTKHPIILAFCSSVPTHWAVSVSPGATIRQVIVGASDWPDIQSVGGRLADVPVIGNDKPIKDSRLFFAYQRDRTEFPDLERKLRHLTDLEVTSLITQEVGESWVTLGPENRSWCEQYVMPALERLWREATEDTLRQQLADLQRLTFDGIVWHGVPQAARLGFHPAVTRCNPLGQTDPAIQRLGSSRDPYALIPGSNVCYGNLYQALGTFDLESGSFKTVGERFLKQGDQVLWVVYDSKRRRALLVTRGLTQPAYDIDSDTIGLLNKKLPTSLSPYAYDPVTDCIVHLDIEEPGGSWPNARLVTFGPDGDELARRPLDAWLPCLGDGGWHLKWETAVVERKLVCVARRRWPFLIAQEVHTLCYVFDLATGELVFSGEMVPQPSSIAADDPAPLAKDAALAKARVGNKYDDLVRQIPAPDDFQIHTEFRDYGFYVGTEWRGYDLPEGYYVYVWPDWYVWRRLTSDVEPEADAQRVRLSTPLEWLALSDATAKLLVEASTAAREGREDEARKLWNDVIEDHPGTIYSYEAMLGLAQDEVANGHYEAGIARLERLPLHHIRAILQADSPMGSGSQPPSRYEKQMAGDVDRRMCSLLRIWCEELGRYKDVARWGWEGQRAQRGPSDDILRELFSFDEDPQVAYYLRFDRDRFFMPTEKFTQMLNGFTIAGGGAARQPILADLATRKELSFCRNSLDDGGMAQLGSLTQLTCLVCQNARVTGQGLAALADLKNLEELRLSDAPFGDEGLEHLAALTKLKTLNLSQTNVTDRGLVHLKDLTRLTSLRLAGTRVTDKGLVHLARLTNLEHLDLPRECATGQTLACLRPFSRLKNVTINGGWIDEEDMANLGELKALEEVSIFTRAGAGQGMKYLAGLTKLRRLIIQDPTVTSRDIVHLEGLQNLEELSLWGTSVDDACIDYLVGLTSLKTLNLVQRPVTPAGIRKLKGHPQLQEIMLSEGRIPQEERKALETDMKPTKVGYYAN